MKKENISFVKYDEKFLELSWKWLRDPEIKRLTMTPDIERKAQAEWFRTLPNRMDYYIWGICADGIPIGAAGIKNIDRDGERGEYFGYIGEKNYIGMGIGKHMVRHMCETAKEMGLTVLYLKVANYNERAYNLYLSQGFQVELERNVDDVLYMKKILCMGGK